MAGEVQEIKNKEEFDAAIKQSMLVVVDFFATWCGPCRQISPYLVELAKELKDKVQFCKVDVDEAEDVAAFCNITAMPTFHFYKNGKLLEDLTGANKGKLKELIDKHQ